MAMASGRLRSTIPLLRAAIAGNGASSAVNGSTGIQRSIICAFQTNPEFSRNFATESATKEIKVKVPVMLFGLFGKYASALYIAAVKANSLEKVEAEFFDLVEASKKSRAFADFMNDLSVPSKTRVNAITQICSEAKISDITRNFLVVLTENGRLRYLDNVAKKFSELTMAHKGEIKAIVTSVIPIPPEEEKELRETLQEVLGKGKKVNLEHKIDPSILGGLVVEYGQKVLDMSIRTRARQMERFLRDPVNFDSI